MSTDGGYREEDLGKRVEALRAERDTLAAELRVARIALRAHETTGWGSFFVGLMVFPGLLVVVMAWMK
jgi:hypothetical protein